MKFATNVNDHEQLSIRFREKLEMISIDYNLVANHEDKKASQKLIFIRKFKKFERFDETKVEKLKCYKRLNVDLNND